MKRTIVLAVVATVTGGLVSTSFAAPPKPMSGSITVTDPTPDPTGGGIANPPSLCEGKLPAEKGSELALPGAGKFKVDLTAFQGDWALAIRDAKGKFLAGIDSNPPDTETVTLKIKKAGTYIIQACNLGGTPQAVAKYTYTPSA